MAVAKVATPTLFFRGSASTTSTVLYTVPASTTSILTDIVVSSMDANQKTVTILVDGVELVPTVPISANSVINFQFKTVLATGKVIRALAGSTNIKLHISGVEVA